MPKPSNLTNMFMSDFYQKPVYNRTLKYISLSNVKKICDQKVTCQYTEHQAEVISKVGNQTA